MTTMTLEPPTSALGRRIPSFAPLVLVLLVLAAPAGARVTEDEARKLAENLAVVFSTGDAELAQATFDPVVRMRSPVLPREAVGLPNLLSFISATRVAFPDLLIEIDDVFVSGDRMAVTFELSGTHDGPLGQAEPTGRSFSLRGMAEATVEGGKILHWQDHWNPLELYQALGMAGAPSPEPGSGAADAEGAEGSSPPE